MEGKSSFQRCSVVAICLVILVTVLLAYHLDFKVQKKLLQPMPIRVQNKVIEPVQINSPKNLDFCRFEPISPENALEERLLLESTAWPETPPVTARFSLIKTSSPRRSYFIILPKEGGQQWHVGDQLKVRIQMKDFQGNPKKTGGDFIVARLHNPLLHAGVTGQVEDHLNGSYSAVFPLLWTGRADVVVTLVHSSEAITFLRRLSKEHPDRVQFVSMFKKGKETEKTICNVCLRPTKEPICNFTDVTTKEPCFCYKPKKLDCDSRVTHSRTDFRVNFGPYSSLFQRFRPNKILSELSSLMAWVSVRSCKDRTWNEVPSHSFPTPAATRTSTNKINMKVPIPPSGIASVNVLPKMKGVNSSEEFSKPGYYFKGVWQTLTGAPIQHFNSSTSIGKCLQNKMLYFYGDSTIRQWFEFMERSMPDLVSANFNSLAKVGPFMKVDYRKRIILRFRVHGNPLRFPPLPVAEFRYVANELDTLIGGSTTVVVLGVWAHFTSFPNEIYIRRLQSIRSAVIRLQNRAPETLVIIKTATLRHLTPVIAWTNSDFYSYERDKILRAIFKGVNVRWVDAWEMVLAHYLPHDVHPKPPIIKNMIDVLLSYICPQRIG